ncbi:MurR/RpiR family transcriptional regulator [Treponema socranskii]
MSDRSVLTDITLQQNRLSEVQKKIASYYLADPQQVSQLTLKTIAEKLCVSETAVIRFIKKIGYKSFKAFQIDVLKDSSVVKNNTMPEALKIEDGYSEIGEADTAETIKKKVIVSAVKAIETLYDFVKDSEIEKVARLFLKAEHILFYGSGGSSSIAMDAHHKFMRLGLPTIYEENSHLAIIRASHLTARDVVVVISHTGESREVLECSKNAKINNAAVVGITSYSLSSLTKVSDITLYSATNTLPYYTDAMVSRLLQLIIFDMIFIRCTLLLGAKGKAAVEISRRAIKSAKKQEKSTVRF